MSSFKGLPAWIEECDNYALSSSDLPRILVGNKCDMKDQIKVSSFYLFLVNLFV